LRLLQDPGMASRMGRQAREEAKARFWPESVAQRTFEVYRQVIEAERRRG